MPVNCPVTVIGKDSFSWKGKETLKLIVEDEEGIRGTLLCYHRNFLGNKLIQGTKIYIYGLFQYKFGQWSCAAFEYELLSKSGKAGAEQAFGRILPVYPLGGSLNQKVLRRSVAQALKSYTPGLKDEIPFYLPRKGSLSSGKEPGGCPGNKLQALKAVHFPDTLEQTEEARNYLIYEEFFHLQTAVGRSALKDRERGNRKAVSLNRELEERLKKALPFALTQDQLKVLDEIAADLSSPRPMNRLVQGDVGSGKTLMAFTAALNVIRQGRQAALMAPTELLARQHAEKAAALLEPLGISVAFLKGSLQSKSRRHLLKELASGNIHLVLGTHALFSEDVIYKDLGLAIIDEQQRFGVAQRQALAAKGSCVDLLYMTATPIPRTLAMTAFGDLDISSIHTMPAGRKPVETHLARQGNEEKVYSFVRRELEKGRQAYFVYPLIEQSEKLALKDAENMYEKLQKIFPQYPAALIHSRIPEEEKKLRMEGFSGGKISLLVATSVVEVGVDVPNATIMVIEQAERFGLSALHQLRGRVGRSDLQSYAFLIYSPQLTEEGKQRLKIMMENNDGFLIAEEDLKLRGPGDMAGMKQSGYMSFRIADLARDSKILLQARADVLTIFREDPLLQKEEHKIIKELWDTAPPFNENLIRSA